MNRLRRSQLLLAMLLVSPVAGVAATEHTLHVDTAKTGAPISPYIYGQFIEHLGRCIYGGIWAEMLEDRKFCYPITAEYAPYRSLKDTPFPVVGASPWEIVGGADGVAMTTTAVFVGDHTPRLREGAAIRQRDLGVVARATYTGYIWAKPAGRGPAEIEVTLSWGENADQRKSVRVSLPVGDYARRAFSFVADASSDAARLEIAVRSGDAFIGTVSLMPADNIRGMRRDTLALLKQLKGTIYRWPGGNFVSGYDWRDGIGDRDRRPPRKNPAWTGIEHNDFGTDEFLEFCREIDTEPMIAANTGFGDAYSAAQWVEYCNGAVSTLAGGWRAKNGQPVPYGVKHWCVGNEMWGPWQLGFMQLHQYTIKHNMVVRAMRAVDPTVKLAAVGDLDGINRLNDPDQAKRGITWSHGMLEACDEYMDLISEHFYEGRVPWNSDGPTDVITHVGKLKKMIRHKADGHRKLQASLPNLKGRIIPIAMDEWNFWHRDYVFGELGCSYDHGDGLGVAAGLHEYFRQSDIIQMAHYAQTVNVIGAIKTTRTAAEMETTGLVLQLYRAQFGQIPLRIEQDFGAVDVAAALTRDGRTLTIGIVNPTTEPVTISLAELAGRFADGPAVRWQIGSYEPAAHNTPGQPRRVDIQEDRTIDPAKPLAASALACAVFAIPLK